MDDLWTDTHPIYDMGELGVATELELSPGIIIAIGICLGFLAWVVSIVVFAALGHWPTALVDLTAGIVAFGALYSACGREDW